MWIRYKQARRRHKERRVLLPTSWPAVLNEYLGQYPSKDFLFPWSARNLEYVLSHVAERADIHKRDKKGISFEMLRWTCPLHYFRRTATTDAQIAGQAVAAGDRVAVAVTAGDGAAATLTAPAAERIYGAAEEDTATYNVSLTLAPKANLLVSWRA